MKLVAAFLASLNMRILPFSVFSVIVEHTKQANLFFQDRNLKGFSSY